MINRILIRIKVIQILYSFLLVEKQFSLEDSPSAPTKEKRFAYSLYLDMLVLMIKLSQAVERRRNEYPLAATGFISRIVIDDIVKSLLGKYGSSGFPFAGSLESVAEEIKESGVYKMYLKELDKADPAAGEIVWKNLFNHVVITSPAVRKEVESRPNFTLKGFERMIDMMNDTFVNFMQSHDNVNEVVTALHNSLETSRDLYFRLLALPVELADLQMSILDENRNKFLKTEEDINPNMKFVDNRIIAALRINDRLRKEVEHRHISWLTEEPVMMRRLLKSVTESDIYRDYMNSGINDVQEDYDFCRNLLKHLVLENVDFLETLEEKSVFWNDDIDILSTFVVKSFRKVAEGDSVNVVLDKFKDEEDERFGDELVKALYKNKELYGRYISEAAEGSNWDSERIAFMDFVILETALAEIMNFPKIPLTVSVNEYIELAKSYSTSKSGAFVHGILGAVIARLRQDGKLIK
ncbi:MAG: transcription antitermination protein NusB [Candidatus Amulumruptor caecigallinarius]|nr:transcription antitermination protein NusB [Candidatus Amulumruptor caecigallinarius]